MKAGCRGSQHSISCFLCSYWQTAISSFLWVISPLVLLSTACPPLFDFHPSVLFYKIIMASNVAKIFKLSLFWYHTVIRLRTESHLNIVILAYRLRRFNPRVRWYEKETDRLLCMFRNGITVVDSFSKYWQHIAVSFAKNVTNSQERLELVATSWRRYVINFFLMSFITRISIPRLLMNCAYQ